MDSITLGLSPNPGVTAATTLSSLGVTTGNFNMDDFLVGGIYIGTYATTITAGETVGSFMAAVNGTNGGFLTASLSANVLTITAAGNPGYGWDVNPSSTTNLATALGLSSAAANTNSKSSIVLSPSGGGISVASSASANDAITLVDAALSKVTSQRGDLGAIENRLQSTMRNLSVSVENMTAAESRMRDTDFADTMTDYTRDQILARSSTAILAHTNFTPKVLLKLLA
jgi:flagellin